MFALAIKVLLIVGSDDFAAVGNYVRAARRQVHSRSLIEPSTIKTRWKDASSITCAV